MTRMQQRWAAAAAVAVSLATAASAGQEPALIFSVPMGHQIKPAPRPCKVIGVAEAPFCWVGRPSKIDGRLFGQVDVPDANLPDWAAHQRVEATMTANGEVVSLSVDRPRTPCPLGDIKRSLSLRFGQPVGTTLDADANPASYLWETPIFKVRAEGLYTCSVQFTFKALHKPAPTPSPAARPAMP